MDVGIRELKQRLSEFLDRASQGETIRVTDRGKPKAILGPLPGAEQLNAGIADGWVRPGSSQPLRPITPVATARSIGEVLDEDRGA
jgi:prevent-host-death family protein